MLPAGSLFWLLPLVLVAGGDAASDSTPIAIGPSTPGLSAVTPAGPLIIYPGPNTQLDRDVPVFGLAPKAAIPPFHRPFFGDPPPDLDAYFGSGPGTLQTHPTSPQIPNPEKGSRRPE